MKYTHALTSLGIMLAITHSFCATPAYSQDNAKAVDTQPTVPKAQPKATRIKIAVADLSGLDMSNPGVVSAAKILLQKAAEEKGASIICEKTALLLAGPDIEIIDISDAVKALVLANPKSNNADAANMPVKDEQKEAKKAALRAVRKLSSAVKSGVSYQSYGNRLADAHAELDEALVDVADGEFKNKIRSAMIRYDDASELWGAAFRWDYASVYLKAIDNLVQKYQLSFEYGKFKPRSFDKVFGDSVKKLVYVSAPLSKIWEQADTEFEEAEKLSVE